MDTSEFLAIELRIQRADTESIIARWESGKWLLSQKDGKQLPKGLIEKLVEQTGVHKRELQYRIKFAEKCKVEEEVRTAVHTYGSWTAVRENLLPDAPGSRPRPEPEPDHPGSRPVPEPLPIPEPSIPITTKASALVREYVKLNDRLADLFRNEMTSEQREVISTMFQEQFVAGMDIIVNEGAEV